jgi:predicted Rossmann fold flavoprotein
VINPSGPHRADVVIVGAGAAGLATAIFVRRLDPSRSVLLLDRARKPGAKILISGGSRCNVTNRVVTELDFWGGRSTFVRRVLRAFTADDAARFFEELGVRLHEEADGKLFPDSNSSREVLAALLRELECSGAALVAGERVLDVVPRRDGFSIVTADRTFDARRVVMATGGRSVPKSGSDGSGYPIAERLGHRLVAQTPALVPLILDAETSIHSVLAGVSIDAEIAIWIDGSVATRLCGALLWTHFGASGPLAMNASRHWLRAREENRRVELTASFRPGERLDTVDASLLEAAGRASRATTLTLLSAFVPAAMARAMLARLSIDESTTGAHLPRDDRRRIARALVEWPLPVAGSRGYNFAEATAGGVALDDVDPGSMESRVCPGLFFVGEVLDVDGRIGGFNFQWAWSTAFVAARGLCWTPP